MISSLELAALCGVSQGTVDRALHNRSGISPATRKRILAAAEAHGYRPNPAARELMGLAVSTVVGLAVPPQTLDQPFFLDLFAALTRKIQGAGLHLSLWMLPEDPSAVADSVAAMAARRLRGLVIIGPPDDLVLSPALVAAQPVVSLMHPTTIPGVHTLRADERASGRIATRHLIDLGHRRIVHLMGDRALHSIRRDRRDGYIETMQAAGLEPRVWPLAVTDGDLIDRLRQERITGVFCHHDPMGITLLRRLAAAGIAVPRDISVVGVDHSTAIRELATPLTSVPYPYDGLADQVVAVMAGNPLPPIREPAVVDEGTTAPPVG